MIHKIINAKIKKDVLFLVYLETVKVVPTSPGGEMDAKNKILFMYSRNTPYTSMILPEKIVTLAIFTLLSL